MKLTEHAPAVPAMQDAGLTFTTHALFDLTHQYMLLVLVLTCVMNHVASLDICM